MLKKLILAINIFSQAYTVGNELGSYEKEDSFSCFICRKEFQCVTEINLYFHILNSHTTCKICKKKFDSRFILNKHLENYHKFVRIENMEE